MTQFRDFEKADCAQREVKQRRRVYARLVERGQMTKSAAEREIALMTEIAADYRAKAEAEGVTGRLL